MTNGIFQDTAPTYPLVLPPLSLFQKTLPTTVQTNPYSWFYHSLPGNGQYSTSLCISNTWWSLDLCTVNTKSRAFYVLHDTRNLTRQQQALGVYANGAGDTFTCLVSLEEYGLVAELTCQNGHTTYYMHQGLMS